MYYIINKNNYNCTNLVNFPISDGMLPDNWLLYKPLFIIIKK